MPRGIWKVASVLGLFASVLSLASLIFQGFQVGVSAPIHAMLSFYGGLLDRLLGWATPSIAMLAASVARLLHVTLHLPEGWKHVFVLMWLYLGNDARASLQQHRPITATATLIVGVPVALAAAAVSGGSGANAPADLALALSVPLIGFLLHAMIEGLLTVAFYRQPERSVRQSLVYYFMTEVLSALLAAPIAIGIGIATFRFGASNASLAGLGAFIFVRATYWLLRGVYIGVTDRAEGETWFRRFVRSGSGQFGILIFSVSLGALLFVAFNAGLS